MEFLLSLTLANWAAIGTLMVALMTLFPRMRKVIASCWNKTIGLNGYLLRRHIVAEEATLNRIEAELHPNGGASLRDRIEAIMDKQFQFEAHMNAALNVHQVALFRTDKDGGVVASNRAHQILTGFNLTQLAGDGWVNVICPKDRSRVLEKWKEAVAAQIEFSEDICYQRPSGKTYEVHVTVYREKCTRGEVRGYVGVVVPIEPDFLVD
jgi:PAS domain S-box-containing protein